MITTKLKCFTAVAIAGASLAFAGSASAIAMVQATVNGNVTAINDNGAGDTSLFLGVITGSAINAGLPLTTSIDFSSRTKPVNGTAANPALASNTTTINTTGPSTVEFLFTDIGFGPSFASFLADLTVNATGTSSAFSVIFDTFLSAANTPFALTTLITTQSTNVNLVAAQVAGGSGLALAGPFSITQRIRLTTTGAGSYAISGDLNSVPDGGATISLMGLTLLGLHTVRRKMAKISS